mgnify:CR=1 FL=1
MIKKFEKRYSMNDKKLCLGTVQLGLDYGINNSKGQPDKKKAFEILKKAIDFGIEYFDTAPVYGNAQEILGDFFRLGIDVQKLRVISKLPTGLVKSDTGYDEAVQLIEGQIDRTIEELGVSVLDGYLIHNENDLYNKNIEEALLECKKNKLVMNLGVSVYCPQKAIDAANTDFIDYIHVPFNIFDRRLVNNNFFNIAKENGKRVFARSVLLQGLMMMKKSQIPDHLKNIEKHLKKLDDIIKRNGFSRLESAFLYPLMHSGIDFVVFGVESPGQLDEIKSVLDKFDHFDTCFNELQNEFHDVDDYILSPNKWV